MIDVVNRVINSKHVDVEDDFLFAIVKIASLIYRYVSALSFERSAKIVESASQKKKFLHYQLQCITVVALHSIAFRNNYATT